ncbi:MAG: divergent polysaccharide deacetylase family protein [Alphaproteobacteria bacterium]|nr:divergent polysaccharide deacetylase family protein [Alphaproteobacteria bacterium]
MEKYFHVKRLGAKVPVSGVGFAFMSENVNDDFVLPPRRETFLARYPRNLKLGITAVLFAAFVLPPAFIHGQRQQYRKPQASFHETVPGNDIEKGLVGAQEIGSDVHAPALNDQNDRSVKLNPAPDVRVTEDTSEGSLPRISDEGFSPWQVYARPFNLADKRPRIAIVISDLGMSRVMADQAIVQLPPTVTLSFDSQAPAVAAWGTRARQDGHEILVQLPVEPFDYPRSDPGPNSLLTNLTKSENLSRLMKTLRRATGYVGVTTTLASQLTADPAQFGMILNVLRDRGLMVLDSRVVSRAVVTETARNAGVPVASVTQRLDADLAPEAINAALGNLEKTALQSGRAVGITAATPLMINLVQAWAKTLPERGIALAPLSSMVQ